MTKTEGYRRALKTVHEWELFLLDESGLPGPRGNIELAQAVADVGTRKQFGRLLTWNPRRAPVGSREEFLAFCGTVGLGRLAAEGNTKLLPKLRKLASDPRWRVREGVAMALQPSAPPTCGRCCPRCGRGRRGMTTSDGPRRQHSASQSS